MKERRYRQTRTHSCSKKTKGRPKVGHGVCHCGLRESVKERIAGKRTCKQWLDWVQDQDPDDSEVG